LLLVPGQGLVWIDNTVSRVELDVQRLNEYVPETAGVILCHTSLPPDPPHDAEPSSVALERSPVTLDVLRPAAALYHSLTQILRLCLLGPFDQKTAGAGLLGLLSRAADLPNFATLDAHLAETQQKVRASFERIVGRVPPKGKG